MPHVHRRVVVSARYHAHIPHLIRALEPYLTIDQKRQLKKDGKYKGQQKSYSTKLDQFAEPSCAAHVRELVIGVCAPGKKHQFIVDRYVEEVVKTLHNLEIVDSMTLSQ